MKTIELKEGEVGGKSFSYKEELKIILHTPIDRNAGADIEEMRRAIRVLDALDATEDNKLVLEDADFDYLKKRMNSAKFAIVDPALVKFVEDVTTITEQ